ncbi:MAG: lamin tail domain-containing protein [Chitinophagaceae bacterium]|nr:lamin tail domain-containing protein [Chitinophagaceae bacterium]MCW5925799.1 lamin tail domain-containing protein [Chitinophagaceae bacterium]
MKNTLSFAIGCLLPIAVFSQSAERYDVVISEIMANPGSSTPLPAVKYLELYNRSAISVNLQNWTIGDAGSTATIRQDFMLEPGSFVLLSSVALAPQLQSYGQTIGITSFPTLRVNGDELMLRSAEGTLIHAVAYSRDWYGNEVKSNGGWSLEMIDTDNPCGGHNNWKASMDNSGGTPGSSNSVAASNADTNPPVLLHAFATDNAHVTLEFDESLDSIAAGTPANYSIVNNEVVAAEALSPFFNRVVLTLSRPIVANQVYTVEVRELTDCSGNTMIPSKTSFGQPVPAEVMDIVINEILFNPKEDGVDYIELFSRGGRIINLKHLFITNKTAAGNTGTLRQLSAGDRLFFPGAYLVLTENAEVVKRHYTVRYPESILEISMPSMPNTAGHIILFNTQGDIVDEVQYEEKWHFPLVSNPKGVALERTDPDKPTQDNNNWHSAAASAGYGTPGERNSQYTATNPLPEEFSLSPQVFSPDNDGFDDLLTISYRFPAPGNVCNISVFDSHGRLVRKLVRNAICGTEGYFRWDGLDENNQQLRIGMYVIYAEIFDPNGNTRQFKKAVTLARRL